jgi:hypothetical protein
MPLTAGMEGMAVGMEVVTAVEAETPKEESNGREF